MKEWPIPPSAFDVDNGELLPWVAQRVAEVVRARGAAGPAIIGFCFSYALDQTALDNGKLLVWTKVGALRAALAAEGLDARVPAVVNDTVATLVALRYSEPATQMGMILGTGEAAAGAACCCCWPAAAAAGLLLLFPRLARDQAARTSLLPRLPHPPTHPAHPAPPQGLTAPTSSAWLPSGSCLRGWPRAPPPWW